MICMKFTELRLEKIDDTVTGTIYRGLTHNFFELNEEALPEEEAKLAVILQRVIERKSPLSELSHQEALPKDFPEKFREEIISVVEMNSLLEKIPSKKTFLQLLESLIRLIVPIEKIQNKALFAETVLHNSVGLKQLAFFSLEKNFEELMVNSLDEVFIFHKKYGMCKANLKINEKVFMNIVQRIAYSIGKDFNEINPLLDARLPDGSRVNATFDNVSPQGISLTIRKFASIPLTILNLIKNNTISSEAAAFLWLMSEGFGVNPKNIIISGGTASGKTTMLSVLSNFIRLSERVVSIEDTLELDLLDRENWVALEAKHSKGELIEMDDLLKNCLRMRPDRIIVGEVRGKEALTLFTAMDNGHAGCLGTVHANSSREAISKLEEAPFNVPKPMLALIDLIVVMQRTYSKEEGMNRRVVQISEISRMENKILLADVFEFRDGRLQRSEVPSHLIEEFANQNSMSKNEIKKELETREIILNWLIEKDVKKAEEVLEVIQSYYFDSQKVLSMIESE
jgi:archaeal flagellar protein FlaI